MSAPPEFLGWVAAPKKTSRWRAQRCSDLYLQGGIIIPVEQDALDRLAAYAVQVRYPGEDPTLDEAREALQVA
jgi:hypothetical protein